jgi:hypothetical protein
VDLNRDRIGTAGVYLEYGWRDNTTIGTDISLAIDPSGAGTSRASLFLRRPIGRTDRASRWAWQVGAGVAWSADIVEPLVEGGLLWGRGLQWGERNGWAAVDAIFRYAPTTSDYEVKLDGTVGLAINDRFKGMMQIFLTHDPDGVTTKLAPSLLFQPRGLDKLTFQIGLEVPGSDAGGTALKLGVWKVF